METKMTCGACMRAVKAGNGRIAHHGYKRPGEGWQTASCIGARMLPWEVSPEGGEAVKAQITRYIAHKEAELVSLNDPARTTITVTRRDYNTRFGTKTATYTKGAPRAYCHINYGFTCFEEQIEGFIAEVETAIKMARRDLVEVEVRLASWKPAVQVAA